MEIRDLEYLVTCADLRTFARAADALSITTSTISRHIGRLEDELGLALFERSASGVRLTTAGAAITLRARRALAELDAVRQAGSMAGAGNAGEIRFGVRISLAGETLSSLLRAWHERFPGVGLMISEMNDRDLAIALDDRRVDVALTYGHATSARFAAMPLYVERIWAVLPAEHQLAKHDVLSLDVLRHEFILVQGWDDSHADRVFYTSLLGKNVRFQSHAASPQSIFALVSAGFGMALAAASPCEIPWQGLVFRPIDDPSASIQISLAWLPGLEDPVVGRFVAFLRDEVRARGLI